MTGSFIVFFSTHAFPEIIKFKIMLWNDNNVSYRLETMHEQLSTILSNGHDISVSICVQGSYNVAKCL